MTVDTSREAIEALKARLTEKRHRLSGRGDEIYDTDPDCLEAASALSSLLSERDTAISMARLHDERATKAEAEIERLKNDLEHVWQLYYEATTNDRSYE